jgi:hypothetical protein
VRAGGKYRRQDIKGGKMGKVGNKRREDGKAEKCGMI